MDVLEDRVSGNNPLIPRGMVTRQMPPSSAPSEVCHHDLPTYEEAITPGPEVPIHTRFVPSKPDILHCNDYSSDPDEARIHFEILSPPDPQEVDIEMLITEEKDGDIHPPCMITFTVTKSR